MSKALVPFNQARGKLAPVIVLIAANRKLAKTGALNSHFEYDTGQAFANFVVQATHLGLSVHQVEGFDREVAAKAVGFKEPSSSGPWEALTMAMVGYWDEEVGRDCHRK